MPQKKCVAVLEEEKKIISDLRNSPAFGHQKLGSGTGSPKSRIRISFKKISKIIYFAVHL
jgi:hypothetical protein